MDNLRDSKRARTEEDLGTLSLITPLEEKADAFEVEFVENPYLASEPLTPEPEVDEILPKQTRHKQVEQEEQWFVGSIDQGTTSSRFLIFNTEGEPVANYQLEFDNLYPQSG